MCTKSVLEGSKAGERMVKVVDNIEYAFRWCPAGTFTMGSPRSEKGLSWEDEDVIWDDEGPEHVVWLTKGFWMMETQVTQAIWQSVMGESISDKAKQGTYEHDLKGEGPNHPMYYVSWNDCQEFCEKLTTKIGMKITLPMEAQWEYACRADTETPFSFGSELNGEQANCDGTAPYTEPYYASDYMEEGPHLKTTTPVRSYAPNNWGLYDMHGNVWEWCQDWYGDYPTGSVEDPTGSNGGSRRVCRGGSWDESAKDCRSAVRGGVSADSRLYDLGFRAVGCPSK